MVGILVYVIDIQLDANFYMISKFVDKKIAKARLSGSDQAVGIECTYNLTCRSRRRY